MQILPPPAQSTSDLVAFGAQLRAAVGRVVPHKGGSGGVYERSPSGTGTELWSYANAVAYSGAVDEVLELLDATVASAGPHPLPQGHPVGQFEWSAFGANYPDTVCVNGVCGDLDDDARTAAGIPCPFCKPEAFFDRMWGGGFVEPTCVTCQLRLPAGTAIQFHDGKSLTWTATCPACGPDQPVVMRDYEAEDATPRPR